jgi:hypothetical protein
MNSIEKSQKEAMSIISTITAIKRSEYDSQLGYKIDKWQITLEASANNIDYINYSRVYVFNTKLYPITNKYVLLHLKMYSLEQFTGEHTDPNIDGFLFLKYPMAEVRP